jgi:dipeptidyl aminopeptidase/acylaminoacyl peptidase
VEIHGGPHGMYGYSLFHEMHLLAAQGYFVYWANPRGSAGYGLAHLLPLVEHWGEPDTEDLMTALDHLLAERPYLDPERVGVLGGSYGGFMTSWLVGHTDRFRAAVSQRAVNNLASFFGTSDFGYYFETTFGGTPWSQPGRYRERSPITYVERVTTPLLIIHSEQDLRCPISQAEELFAALKIIGKAPAELVRFSGESHGLSRGGRPRNRMERLRRILDWFERYL